MANGQKRDALGKFAKSGMSLPSSPARAEAAMSAQLFEAICFQVSEGRTVKSVLAEPGMPSRKTFDKWRHEHPEAEEIYAAALKTRADDCRDKICDAMSKLEAGTIDPASARVLVEGLKWLAAKDAPARYSDRFEMTGASGEPLIANREIGDIEAAQRIAFALAGAIASKQKQLKLTGDADAQPFAA
jgi:hypothetical protein